MRPQLSLVFALVPSLLAFAAAPSHTHAVHTTAYHSNSMNFDFTYPATFTSSGKKSADTDCVSTPLAVMDMHTSFNMIFLKSYRQSCLSKDVRDAGPASAASKVLKDMLGEFGKPTMSPSSNYAVSGHQAAAATGSAKASGAHGPNTIYGVASCFNAGDNLACFEFLSNDCANLTALASNFIKFTGSAAAPLIPRKLASGCKQ